MCEEGKGVGTTGVARCSPPLQGFEHKAGSTGEQLGKKMRKVKRGSKYLRKQMESPTKPNTDQFYSAQITDPAMSLHGSIF